MVRILVTVGMGPWPFDRLIRALGPLCAEHDVFAQTGTSTVTPPCPHQQFVPFSDLQERIAASEVVITHAGNTVRLVQRAGKVPIAVARRASLGEMGNDHQVAYLRLEERTGPVVAVWEPDDLQPAVATHAAQQAQLLRERPLPPAATADQVIHTLDSLCARLCRGERHDR
jgi:UDP-N-acetylglucosamine transferase subunit ALG13